MSKASKDSDTPNTGTDKEKKIFHTDPLPIIRYLNMALALGMLVYSVMTILSFTSANIANILMALVFSVYQV